MPSVHYRIVNVFAEKPFGGNPLAVIEDGSGLGEQDMQAIARQFNLSETTFLLPSRCAAARIRIFTPAYEMPFAGHPTLGSAHVVRELFEAGGRFELEMPAGLIPVELRLGRWSLTSNVPTHRPIEASTSELAQMLKLPESAIGCSPLWVDCGSEQAIIPLNDVTHVRAARPEPALLARFATNTDGRTKAYVIAPTADGYEARFFWSPDGAGIAEDPGTGSACANVGGWWRATHKDQPLEARITQGLALNRPNVLSLKVDASGQIHVGGRVIEIGRGELRW